MSIILGLTLLIFIWESCHLILDRNLVLPSCIDVKCDFLPYITANFRGLAKEFRLGGPGANEIGKIPIFYLKFGNIVTTFNNTLTFL